MARQRVTVAIIIAVAVMLGGAISIGIAGARRAEALTRCINNLKQFGIAATNYHDAYKALPPGWWGAIPDTGGITAEKTGPANGPIIRLLPFLEYGLPDEYSDIQTVDKRTGQLPVLWDLKVATSDQWPSVYQSNYQIYPNSSAFVIAAMSMRFLQCPADTDSPLAGDPNPGPFRGQRQFIVSGSVNSFDHGSRAGDPKGRGEKTDWGQSAPGEWSAYFGTLYYDSSTKAYNPLGRVNYAPVAGLGHGQSPFYRQFEGVFTDRSAVTLGAVQEAYGQANTLLFGETAGQFHRSFGDNAFQVNFFTPALPTHRGLNQRCAPGARGSDAVTSDCDGATYSMALGQRARVNSFGSGHPSGVAFAFCDGSVRVISRGQTWVKGSHDWYLFQSLAGYHDGFRRD